MTERQIHNCGSKDLHLHFTLFTHLRLMRGVERTNERNKKHFLTAINRRRMQQEMQLTHPNTNSIQF